MKKIIITFVILSIAAISSLADDFNYENHFKFKVGDLVTNAIFSMDSLGCKEYEFNKKENFYDFFCDVKFLEMEWVSTTILVKKKKVESIMLAGEAKSFNKVLIECLKSDSEYTKDDDSYHFFFDNCSVALHIKQGCIFIAEPISKKKKGN